MYLCHAINVVFLYVGWVSVDNLILTWSEGFFGTCTIPHLTPSSTWTHSRLSVCLVQFNWLEVLLKKKRPIKKKKLPEAWQHGTGARIFCQDFSLVSDLHLSEELWLDIHNLATFLYSEDVVILSCRLSCSCLFLVCCTSLRFCPQRMEVSQMLKEYLVLHVIQLLTRSVLKNGGSGILNLSTKFF